MTTLEGALPGESTPEGVRAARVVAWRGGQAVSRGDWLAEEMPVALVFNGISHAVMLATPADLEAFALGFALTEGLVRDASEVYGIEAEPTCDGIEVRLEVAAECEWRLKERRRNLAGRTGCGLCGTESLDQVRRTLPSALPLLVVPPQVPGRAQRLLRERQARQALTGAVHAAAWCDAEGHILQVCEDIGRHNALDKLAGAMSRAGIDPAQGWVLVTSRASFEMVQKTAMIGAGLLVAVSAPTTAAVDLAERAGLALAGFARGDDFVAYTYPERFGLMAEAG